MAVTVPDLGRTRWAESSAARRPDRKVQAVVATQGAALALLVGRDGSAAWQVGRVLAVVVATAAALRSIAVVSQRRRGLLLMLGGTTTVAIGLGFMPYLVKDGPSPVSLSAVVLLGAGFASLVLGGLVATARLRPLGRLSAGAGALVVTAAVAFIVAPAVAATNVPRPPIGATPDRVGLEYEAVRLTTTDGVDLAAWYVESTNEAAVVLLHGAGSTRSNVLDQAVVFARHGYGVLLLDARGHGESAGRAMDFGWYGDVDIAAATGYLSDRREVDPTRIGVVGMSMGGEEAIGATATNATIRAVVAEGATARSAGDEAWLSEEFGWRGAVQEKVERVQDWVTDLMTDASPPVSSRAAVERSADARYLLITAGREADERHAADHVAAAAPDRVYVWTVPGAAHTGGLATAPAEWELRVIGFLDEALAARGSSGPR